MLTKYTVFFIFLSIILTNCGDYKQRDNIRRSVDSSERMARRIENMNRQNYDIYNKIDNFFYILDDFYNTTHYAKESLKYTTSSVNKIKLKEISAYFTKNDPYPDNRKDINYCEQISNFFTKVIDLKNQNIPKGRVKLILEKEYLSNNKLDSDEVFYNKRLQVTNISVDKLYNTSGKINPSEAKLAFKQGCLEVDLK
jgi:hypothetical protein